MKHAPKTVTFEMTVTSGTVNVRREFVFSGAKINLDIEVPITKEETGSVTVAQIHQRSVRMAIEMLQGLVPPEQ